MDVIYFDCIPDIIEANIVYTKISHLIIESLSAEILVIIIEYRTADAVSFF